MKEKDNGITYPKVTTWDVMREYWKSAKKYWHLGLFSLVGISISTSITSVIIPTYYKSFFDFISQAVPNADSISTLISIVSSVLVIALIGALVHRGAYFCMTAFEGKVMMLAKERAFDYLIGHSQSFFSDNFAGSLVQRINRFTRSFETIFDRIFMDIFPLMIKIIGAATILYLIEPRISLIIVLWVLIFMIFSFTMTRLKYKYDLVASQLDSKTTGALSDSISNHPVIQLFTGISFESVRFGKINLEHVKANLFRWNLNEAVVLVQALITVFAEFAVFYVGIKYWNAGILSVGTFVLIQAFIISINGSLWNFGRIIRYTAEGISDAKEMVEILHLPHEIQDASHALKLQVPYGLVEFKNVSFVFGKNEQNKPVFTNLSISIKAGEKVALIGSSGAGKSTFVKLLLRLHDIKGGQILIDGQNIADVTQESLRENISLVPQDPALFHRSLMENIRYGRRDASNDDVVQASKLAHCDIFIKDFPQKYETFVGERGIKLSGGERQRVAIARALLKNAPILILDEATSSLDSHSESLIQDALNTLMKGKTTLVIAHRLSTIRKMDRIIVLGKNGVIEEGSHDELIKTNGTYAHLWNLQAGGFADKSIEDMLEGQ